MKSQKLRQYRSDKLLTDRHPIKMSLEQLAQVKLLRAMLAAKDLNSLISR